MAVRGPRWTFFDPTTSETYAFDINPKEGGLVARKKAFAYQSMAAPDGGLIAMENQDPLPPFQFTGTVMSEAQYDAMIAWFTKPRAVVLTDDLGLVSTIFITAFSATRIRTNGFPWRHDYVVDAFFMKAGA